MKRVLAFASLVLATNGAALAQEAPVQPQWTGPQVTLETTMGSIVVTLDTVGAPKTAAHFLGLVQAKYFDGAAVYRIEPGFVVQLGDLDANLQYREPPLPPVELETATNRHVRGAVALARADDPASGHGTFYIDMGDNPHLNATEGAPPNTTGYAVFGHVTSGIEVVEAIEKVELAPEGGPFPGKLPKVSVTLTRASIKAD